MYPNAAPHEILAGPLKLWLAPVGTAFPVADDDPAAGWTLVAASGPRNFTEDGVSVQHPQSFEEFRAAGSTGPLKAFRTEEGLMIGVTIADLTLEAYKLALNGNTVAAVAAGVGTPGTKTIGLSRGASVTEYALLARGASPYGDGMQMQYEVPRVYQSGEPEPQFEKGTPAGLALQFSALEDPDASSEDERFGRLVAMTELAET